MWTCPKCGKKLKRQGNHPQTHDEFDQEELYNIVEETLSLGPAMGGEVGRLRTLMKHDQQKDWTSVYNQYVKVTKGDGSRGKRSPLEGASNTRRERQLLREQIASIRKREEW